MKKIFLTILAIICFYYGYYYLKNFYFIKTETSADTKPVEQTILPEKKEHAPKNNNFENINFNEQVATNRSIINEKFPGNYIDRSLKSGELVRWNPSTFPLEVYVEHNPDLPDYYDKTVKRAFAKWQKESKNFITFSFTDIEEYADIKCFFPKNYKSENDGQRMLAGLTTFKFEDKKLKYAQISLATYDMNKNFRTENALYSTALHEIGHALGISGHSVNKEDIMYPVTRQDEAQISKNDINTLKLIYSIVPDVTNQNYSKTDKEKYITTEDVLGDYDTRLDLELEAVKADLNADKNSYFSGKYFNMANIYYKKKDFQKAIKNYEKGLSMTSNEKDIEAVNMNIAICYNELKNYDKALKHAQISDNLKNTPDKSAFIANLYYQKGEFEKAKNLALKVLSATPENYNSYIVLYHVYKHEDNEVEIYKLYEQAKKYFPDNPPILVK